jgi:hypothetical protein
MKLDTEWITRMAARSADAEQSLVGGGAFTHRSPRIVTSAKVASHEAFASAEIQAYKLFRPKTAPQARWESRLAIDA